MRNPRPVRPVLEALDDRVLLSQTAVLPVSGAPAALVTPTPIPPTLHLTGRFSGNYTTTDNHPIPDVGRTVTFRGSGVFDGHSSSLAGSIHLGGFVPIDQGQVTITTAAGRLTLKLQRALIPLASSETLHLNATIVSGTGVYSHLVGSGTASLTFTPAINLLKPGTQTGRMTFSVDLHAHH